MMNNKLDAFLNLFFFCKLPFTSIYFPNQYSQKVHYIMGLIMITHIYILAGFHTSMACRMRLQGTIKASHSRREFLNISGCVWRAMRWHNSQSCSNSWDPERINWYQWISRSLLDRVRIHSWLGCYRFWKRHSWWSGWFCLEIQWL